MLQDLGLKEYEARCFTALTQLSGATAAEISDHSEVPRTRVYDAVHVLEAQGLVEVQHSSPQQFRAVSVEEAATTMRRRYDDRIDTLEAHLDSLHVETEPDDSERLNQVWSLRGGDGIQSRTEELLTDATDEIVLLVVDEDVLTTPLVESLTAAIDRGVTVIAGGSDEAVTASIRADLPDADVFESDLGWLTGSMGDDEVAISRLVLADRSRLLIGSYYPDDGDDHEEQAVFADGLENGVVVLTRRLIASGLPSSVAA